MSVNWTGVVRRALWACPAAGFGVAYYFRPLNAYDASAHEKEGGVEPDLTMPPDMPGGAAAVRALGGQTPWAAAKAIRCAAEWATISIVGSASSLWMRVQGTTDFVGSDEEELKAWITDADHRRKGRPLLTVFNHHSCVDEPLVMGRVLPMSTTWWPYGANFGPLGGAEASVAPGLLDGGTTRTALGIRARKYLSYSTDDALEAWRASCAETDAAAARGADSRFRAANRELFHSRGAASMRPTTAHRGGRASMRFSICTDEVCFGTPATAAFFSAGRANPVLRNRTSDQPGMTWMQSHLDAGHWVNIFPEARTWQEGGTPLRDAEGRWTSPGGRAGAPMSGVGPFKRGVGKLVANARLVPQVVAVFHQGMATVLPQTPENDVLSFRPVPGHDVTIGISDPVDCTDLVVAYHRAAHERAVAREARRVAAEADGWTRPPPLSGHRRAIGMAQREFGSAPPSFCGVAVPPGADVVDFGHRTVRGAGAVAKAAARAVFEEAEAELRAAAAARALAASADDSGAAADDAEAAATDNEAGAPGDGGAGAASPDAAPALAVSDEDLAALDAASGPWTGSRAEVEEWEAGWEGRVWVPTRPVRNRHSLKSARGEVPCYLEGPIRARPRDFLWLSPREAIEEHRHTLALYEAITARIEDAERAAEAKVLAHRHAGGRGPYDSDRS